jgi:carboxyl-terminal processing protease
MNDNPLSARRFLPVGLFIVLAFLLGAYLERLGWLPGGPDREPASARGTFTPFWEAWNVVEEHFVEKKSVNPERMTQFAIAGMLDSLGDEGHTTYLTRDDVKRMKTDLEGTMEGIGARITVRNHMPTILMPMPDSPAAKAGLQPGDVILAVDNEPVGRESLQQLVQKVRGPADTKVTLRIHRDGQSQPMEITITRGQISIPDVSWHMLPGQPYAHIAIESFGDKADEQLKAKLKEALEHGAKGVILDLRGNPGGLKDQAVAVTSEFLKDGDVFIDQDEHGKQKAVPVKPGGMAADLPLVVLTDGGTASAAEICAGALQDHERAKVVGEKTFGTGTVLQPYDLSDGSAILLATSEWLTPKGRQIWHQGLKPDIEVALPDGATALLPEVEQGMDPSAFQKSDDAQLLKALAILREQVEGKAAAEGK